MTPAAAINTALSETFRGADGQLLAVTLEPALSDEELGALEAKLRAKLPEAIREVLRICSGFHFPPIGFVDLRGQDNSALIEILPNCRMLAGDRLGNRWVVETSARTGEWAPVLYLCHDPAVLVIQAKDVADFLTQVFHLGRSGQPSAIDLISSETVHTLWATDPFLEPVEIARQSTDTELAVFAQQLPDGWKIADLRSCTVGRGFSWGRYGPDAELRRAGGELLFGVGPTTTHSLLRRLLRLTA